METEKANWEKERIEFKESWDLAIQQLNEDFESELKDFLDSSNQEIENFENQINDMKEIQFSEQTNLISRWDSEIVARQNRIRRNLVNTERSTEDWEQSVSLDSEGREMDWKYNAEQIEIDINMNIADLRDQILFLQSQADIEKKRLDMEDQPP